jgi:hypothetical protein
MGFRKINFHQVMCNRLFRWKNKQKAQIFRNYCHILKVDHLCDFNLISIALSCHHCRKTSIPCQVSTHSSPTLNQHHHIVPSYLLKWWQMCIIGKMSCILWIFLRLFISLSHENTLKDMNECTKMKSYIKTYQAETFLHTQIHIIQKKEEERLK